MNETQARFRETRAAIKQHGFPIEPSAENLAERYTHDPEQKAIDLYALLVPVIGEVVTDMTGRPPKSYQLDSFSALEQQAKNSLSGAISHYVAAHPRSENDPLWTLADEFDQRGSLRGLIEKGSNTATRFMNGVLQRIPDAVKQKYTETPPRFEHVMEVAKDKSTYAFIVMNAAQHVTDLTALRNFQNYGNEASFTNVFRLLRLDDEDQLYYPEEVLKNLPPSFRQERVAPANGGERGKIGCPAMYSTAIRELWEWHLRGAEQIYRKNLSTDPDGYTEIFPALSAD